MSAWSSELSDADELSLVHHTLCSAQEVDDDDLDLALGLAAIAACEAVARVHRRRGRERAGGRPPLALVRIAISVLDRISSHPSELAQLAARDHGWRASLQDLRRRLTGHVAPDRARGSGSRASRIAVRSTHDEEALDGGARGGRGVRRMDVDAG